MSNENKQVKTKVEEVFLEYSKLYSLDLSEVRVLLPFRDWLIKQGYQLTTTPAKDEAMFNKSQLLEAMGAAYGMGIEGLSIEDAKKESDWYVQNEIYKQSK